MKDFKIDDRTIAHDLALHDQMKAEMVELIRSLPLNLLGILADVLGKGTNDGNRITMVTCRLARLALQPIVFELYGPPPAEPEPETPRRPDLSAWLMTFRTIADYLEDPTEENIKTARETAELAASKVPA